MKKLFVLFVMCTAIMACTGNSTKSVETTVDSDTTVIDLDSTLIDTISIN